MLNHIPGLFRTRRRWLIVGLLFLLAAVNNLDRQTLSVLGPTMQRIFHFGPKEYSYIVTAFLAGYSLGYLFCGAVIDRFGIKLALAGALAFWSLASGLHAFATGWLTLALFRFLLGIGESFTSPAGVKAVAEWIPPRERGLSMAIFSNGNIVGAIIAPPLIAMLALHLSWRGAFLVPALAGFVLLALWWRKYRDPESDPRLTEQERQLLLQINRVDVAIDRSMRSGWLLLLNPVCAGFFVVRFLTDPVTYFLSFWVPNYLSHGRGFSLVMIGLVGWIPFFASDLGGPGGGALSDLLIRLGGWVPRRARSTVMLGAACLMPVAAAIIHVRTAALAILLIAVAFAAQSCWMANQLALISESVDRADVGKVLALSALGGSLGGMISTLIAGRVISAHGYGPVFTTLGFLHLIAWGVLRYTRPAALKPKLHPLSS